MNSHLPEYSGTMDIQFEELKEHHLSEIKSIYDWYIQNSTATFHTEPISIDQLREFIYIGHSLYKSFIIKADQALAGYCILTNHKKRQAYDRTAEVTLYLKPEFHKQGIGRVALQHLETQAIAVGLKNLIGVITGENSDSMALFEKAGFTKCAHYKNVGEKFNRVLDVVAYQKEI